MSEQRLDMSEVGTTARCRIVLADDHELIREGIAAVIAREPGMTVSGIAADEMGMRELLARHRPDLLLIDLALGQRDQLVLLREVASAFPQTRILALATYAEERYAERVLRSGASGYFIKSASAAHLVRAIRAVAAGAIYASPRLAVLASPNPKENAANWGSWLPSQ